MDESTSALDPISTSKIEDLAAELKKDYTIIMVTPITCSRPPVFPTKPPSSCWESWWEFGDTEQMFSMPKNKKTEDYITGRFG